MNRNLRRVTLIIAFTLYAASFCFADIKGDNGEVIPTAKVEIPVSHVIKGDRYSSSDSFTFVLTAEKEGNPMPEGSSGGEKKVDLKGEGTVSFGKIEFDYPEAYYYTITESAPSVNGLTGDKTIYRVMIAKYNNEVAHIVTWNKASGEKTDKVVFTDRYSAPFKPEDPVYRSIPKTGDSMALAELMVFMTMFVLSAEALFIIAAKRKERASHEKK